RLAPCISPFATPPQLTEVIQRDIRLPDRIGLRRSTVIERVGSCLQAGDYDPVPYWYRALQTSVRPVQTAMLGFVQYESVQILLFIYVPTGNPGACRRPATCDRATYLQDGTCPKSRSQHDS